MPGGLPWNPRGRAGPTLRAYPGAVYGHWRIVAFLAHAIAADTPVRYGPGVPTRRSILGNPPVAACWLLLGCVLFGPVGLTGSAVLASMNKACGITCPCDEAVHRDRAGEPDGHVDADSCDEGSCKDECPDDCRNCGCCLGIGAAVLPVPVVSDSKPRSTNRLLAPGDVPPSGAGTCVFRPPRPLA